MGKSMTVSILEEKEFYIPFQWLFFIYLFICKQKILVRQHSCFGSRHSQVCLKRDYGQLCSGKYDDAHVFRKGFLLWNASLSNAGFLCRTCSQMSFPKGHFPYFFYLWYFHYFTLKNSSSPYHFIILSFCHFPICYFGHYYKECYVIAVEIFAYIYQWRHTRCINRKR